MDIRRLRNIRNASEAAQAHRHLFRIELRRTEGFQDLRTCSAVRAAVEHAVWRKATGQVRIVSARPWPLSPRSRLMRGPRARSRGRQRPIHGCLRSCLSHPRQFALKFWRLSESTEHDPICHRVLDAGRQRPRVAGAGPRPSRAIPIHAAAADQDTAVIVGAELFAYSRRGATGAGPKAVALGSVSRHAAARPIGLSVDT